MELQWFRRHRTVVRAMSVAAPLAISAALFPVRESFPDSAATLLLVLLVVGSAATGDRLSGLLAALAAAAGFDFFLTTPYLQLRIDRAEDILLAVLLLVVGLAVSELASWGIRQSAAADQQAALVKRALESADLAAGSTNQTDGLDRVAASIQALLGAEQVAFEDGEHDPTAAVINRDGTMRYKGRTVDASLTGLPRGPYDYAAIPIVRQGAQLGYFRVSNPRNEVRPTRVQLRVAVLLAGEWSLRTEPVRWAPTRR